MLSRRQHNTTPTTGTVTLPSSPLCNTTGGVSLSWALTVDGALASVEDLTGRLGGAQLPTLAVPARTFAPGQLVTASLLVRLRPAATYTLLYAERECVF